mmetsp:Transcript_73966/g.158521  ORF Transcript_73966/g.158521 Transcript_73966/m.158521 type:complete len:174 (-) Transcript_73966:115-636(-)
MRPHTVVALVGWTLASAGVAMGRSAEDKDLVAREEKAAPTKETCSTMEFTLRILECECPEKWRFIASFVVFLGAKSLLALVLTLVYPEKYDMVDTLKGVVNFHTILAIGTALVADTMRYTCFDWLATLSMSGVAILLSALVLFIGAGCAKCTAVPVPEDQSELLRTSSRRSQP